MQIFVRSVRGKSFPLHIGDFRTVADLRAAVEDITHIPVELHRLLFAGRDISTAVEPLSLSGLHDGATVQLALRLRGGKGGFGALLRGQGRDGGITTNFDACRDLTGRRLRHVNAEKKLEEWVGQSNERDLEKIGLRHVSQREKETSRAKRTEVNIDEIRKQQVDTVNGVKSAVAAGLTKGSNRDDVKRAAEASTSQEPNCKKPKFYFPEDEGEDYWSSDADDSCNNQGSALHSVEQNNDSRNGEENGLNVENGKAGMEHQSGDSGHRGQESLPEETSNLADVDHGGSD